VYDRFRCSHLLLSGAFYILLATTATMRAVNTQPRGLKNAPVAEFSKYLHPGLHQRTGTPPIQSFSLACTSSAVHGYRACRTRRPPAATLTCLLILSEGLPGFVGTLSTKLTLAYLTTLDLAYSNFFILKIRPKRKKVYAAAIF
jgi:hypothetical protein